MEFVRKKKHGQSQKVRRTWFSEDGYRVVWRKEVCGVRVPARFQACVRTLIPFSDGQLRQIWDFVNRNRRLMKTLKAAEEECEKHKRFWTKACEAKGIRALKELFGGKLLLGLPLWVRKKLDRRLYAILIDNRPMTCCNDEEDETCTKSSQPSSDASGPGGPIKPSESSALCAKDNETPTPRKSRRARLKTTSSDEPLPASPDDALAEGREKAAANRIEQSPKRPENRKRGMTNSSACGAKRSRSPRKTKSLRSVS